MSLPPLSFTFTDLQTGYRRLVETINAILNFTFDDSRIRTAAEIAAGVMPVNYAYEPLDPRRYGWVNDGAFSGSPPVFTGTNNYTAIANALLVAAQTNANGITATVRIASGGTNIALVQGSTSLTWPDSVGIEVDQNVNIAWHDNNTGAFCLTNGTAGARRGSISSRNLSILLATQTACGIHLFNTVQGTYINTYVQGYLGSYGTRSNIGLKMEATTGTGACWFNDFYGINLNHCHTGLSIAASGGFVTQNTFRNFRFYGDAPSDTSSVAINAQGGTTIIVDGFWIEAVGPNGFGFDLGAVAGDWQVDNGAFDTGAGSFTAIFMGPGSGGHHFGKKVFFGQGALFLNENLPSAQNVIESYQGTNNGDSWASAVQGSVGLNAGQGYIGSFFSPGSGSTLFNGAIQAIQGGCYNPLDNQLYLLSRQGNVLAYSGQYGQITQGISYSGTQDSDVLSCCFCPVNNYIYISDRLNNRVVVLNPRTWVVVQNLALGANTSPYGIAYCPFNKMIYVANNGSAQTLAIITPTLNATDSIAQNLAGFGIGLIGLAYCPITQRMYVSNNGTSIFCVATTTNATDSIAQTIATALGTACYAIAYCPQNQKICAVSSGSTKFVSINPTTNGTDTVLTSSNLIANGLSASSSRGISWNAAAGAFVCASAGNLVATILPSASGSADICTQVQASAGGTTLGVLYHPGMAKSYEINSSLGGVPEWS